MSSRLALAMSASALVVALLGSTPLGHALASQVPRSSVGPLQLKRNAVGPQKLAPNAVRSNHVLNGSLLAGDFKAGQLPAGAKGDKGDKGDRGEPGPPGLAQREVVTMQSALDSTALKSLAVTCPAGKVALGGGARIIGGGSGAAIVASSYPQGDAVWRVEAFETIAYALTWRLDGYAVCARVG